MFDSLPRAIPASPPFANKAPRRICSIGPPCSRAQGRLKKRGLHSQIFNSFVPDTTEFMLPTGNAYRDLDPDLLLGAFSVTGVQRC